MPVTLRLIGEPVIVSYIANPFIGHGQFRLENHGASAVAASIDAVWLELGESRKQLSDISAFDLDHDRPANPDSLTVEAESMIRFLVGFPRLAHEPPFGESAAVRLRVHSGGVQLQAVSPIKFVRRIPDRR
jgi:hypothetical protein